jgi:hypothetical protein
LREHIFINDPIDELHTLYGDVFLGAGGALQSAVEVIIFGLYLMAYGPNLVAVFRFFIRYVLRMTFVHFVLNYYYKPIGFLTYESQLSSGAARCV